MKTTEEIGRGFQQTLLPTSSPSYSWCLFLLWGGFPVPESALPFRLIVGSLSSCLLRDIARVFVFSFSSVLNFPSVLDQGMACRDTRTLCSLKYWGFPHGSDGKDSACSAGDLDSILGAGRSPGEGDGNPLQYSCLEDSMDRGAWRVLVHGVTKSLTPLSG